MRVVTYSLFGSNEKYLTGAIENAKSVRRVYPGWTARFYVSKSVPQGVCEKLRQLGAQVVQVDGEDQYRNTLWRFKAFSEPGIEYAISRDCDSRLTLREAQAVEAWIESRKKFHIMRDHPWHQSLILAGMCGAVGGVVDFDQIWCEAASDRYGIDQDILARHVYPKVRRDSLIHDSFCKYEVGSAKFPGQRVGGEFVGEVVDENGGVDEKQRAALKAVENSFLRRTGLVMKTLAAASLKSVRRKIER